jgi:hypothetical protein
MKNAYLNSVFIAGLYLHTIQKHNKNILLIKQRKNEKNKIIKHIK